MNLVKRFGDIEIELIPNEAHEFLLSTAEVAKGYGVSEVTIRRHKKNHADELIEGKHWVVQIVNTPGGLQEVVSWTKRGTVRLGFFIKSDQAKRFRDWTEDLVIRELDQSIALQNTGGNYLVEFARIVQQIQRESKMSIDELRLLQDDTIKTKERVEQLGQVPLNPSTALFEVMKETAKGLIAAHGQDYSFWIPKLQKALQRAFKLEDWRKAHSKVSQEDYFRALGIIQRFPETIGSLSRLLENSALES